MAAPEECQDGDLEYGALYDPLENEIALTPHCTEDIAVRLLVHEVAHWSQTLGMTKREIEIEAGLYDANLKKLGAQAWLDYSIIERMASWVEECVEETT